MKQVVCIVDNHIYLKYGKVYNVVGEMDTDYKLERTDDGLLDIHVCIDYIRDYFDKGWIGRN